VTTSGFDVFGTGVRTKALVALSVLGESHVAELSQILGAGATTVRNAVDTLEQAGLVVGRYEGKARRLTLNPRFRARDELKALLDKLAHTDAALLSAIADLRRRPRRAGKPL
jgi:DNA-binding transcriptional ArsR family regulator